MLKLLMRVSNSSIRVVKIECKQQTVNDYFGSTQLPPFLWPTVYITLNRPAVFIMGESSILRIESKLVSGNYTHTYVSGVTETLSGGSEVSKLLCWTDRRVPGLAQPSLDHGQKYHIRELLRLIAEGNNIPYDY